MQELVCRRSKVAEVVVSERHGADSSVVVRRSAYWWAALRLVAGPAGIGTDVAITIGMHCVSRRTETSTAALGDGGSAGGPLGQTATQL